MKKGHNWGVEWKTEIDRRTGVEVVKLCEHGAHHHHLYFTNPGWYDNDNKLILSGDRGNGTNLFSMDVRSGELTQLTDFNDRPPAGLALSCVNLVANEAHYWHAGKLWALSLDTLEERPLWTLPPNSEGDMLNATADGKFVMLITSFETPPDTSGASCFTAT